MPIAPTKIQSITLRHQIVSRIRQSILDGSLFPGERIVERALAAKLGSSVTAVREAIIHLEAEGLITKRSNSTTHITALGKEEIKQTFIVRRHLESLAISAAAQHATPLDVRRLTRLHERAVEAAVIRDPRLYIQRDFEWHQAVWAASGNDVLAATLHRLALPLFGFSAIQTVSQVGFDLEADAQLHAAILAAIGTHDSAAAVRAFERGIREWTTHVREHEPRGPQERDQPQEHELCAAVGD